MKLKQHKLFVLLLVTSLSFGVSAQTAKQNAELQRLRGHVNYLASAKLDGRRTGTAGATVAAGYVAGLFAKYGLKAGVVEPTTGTRKTTKASYLQSFAYTSGVELGKDNLMRLFARDRNEYKMELGGNYAPFGASPNGFVPSSPVVFAGYGVVASEANYDDYANLDVKDKIVLTFAGTPDKNNPNSSFARFDVRAKARLAKERGALALLVVADEESFSNEKLAKLNYEQSLGEAALPTVIIARSSAQFLFAVNSDTDLRELENKFAANRTAPEFAERTVGTTQLNINLTKIPGGKAYNVIGILPGNDPILKNEAMIVGAHYDHLGRGGQGSLAINSKDIHYGADDNASGTAALLELARTFAENNKKPRRTMIFIAFGAEEEGLLGSKHYTNSPAFPLQKTVAMFNLDMVGRLKDNRLTIGGVGTAGEWQNMISFLNSSPPNNIKLIPPGSDVAPNVVPVQTSINGQPILGLERERFSLQINEDGFGPSDHSSFYGKQIPVLFFFTGVHEDYHKPTDTPEKINYDGLQKITDFVHSLIGAVDQNDKRPTYTTAKSSGMMMGSGRGSFRVSLGTIPSYSESNDGLLLDGVRDDSPAAKAGLKAGDKIVRLAAREIRNVSDYTFALGEMKAEQEYEVEIVRGQERLTLKITPAARK